MGDVLKKKVTIGRARRYEVREDQVGTVWQGVIMAKHISRQGTSLTLQAKEGMDKMNYRALSETVYIKSYLQTDMEKVGRID